MDNIRFHQLVQRDLNNAMTRYSEVSDQLADDFYAEFIVRISQVEANPRMFHFEGAGLRRCNLERFPYHLLYDIRDGYVRVWCLRHDHQNPHFGQRRFSS